MKKLYHVRVDPPSPIVTGEEPGAEAFVQTLQLLQKLLQEVKRDEALKDRFEFILTGHTVSFTEL